MKKFLDDLAIELLSQQNNTDKPTGYVFFRITPAGYFEVYTDLEKGPVLNMVAAAASERYNFKDPRLEINATLLRSRVLTVYIDNGDLSYAEKASALSSLRERMRKRLMNQAST